jgi:hypothetical protein
MEKLSEPESYLPLKPNWFHVLLSLVDQEQHGYRIMLEVLERTDGKVRLWPATCTERSNGSSRRALSKSRTDDPPQS